MVMIARENPRMNKPQPGLFASFTKRLDEHPPILVDSDMFSPVTSRHDMVHRALKLDSDLSRHPSKSSSTFQICQELLTDPLTDPFPLPLLRSFERGNRRPRGPNRPRNKRLQWGHVLSNVEIKHAESG
jgi:hypothetical protein